MNLKPINFDLAEPWQRSFQDGATNILFQLNLLHDQIMFYLILILVFVLWFTIKIVTYFNMNKTILSHYFLIHGPKLEFIWTTVPVLILVFIAVPSFKLLYITDEIINPQITLKIVARQWNWNYQYGDYNKENFDGINFDS